MQPQSGSAAKPLLLLTLFIAAGITIYLSFTDAKRLEPQGGQGAAFVPHDAMLRAELQALPSQRPFTVDTVAESGEMTHVDVNSPTSTECDQILMNQVYLTCTAHRVQQHRDNRCHIMFHFGGGECSHPAH